MREARFRDVMIDSMGAPAGSSAGVDLREAHRNRCNAKCQCKASKTIDLPVRLGIHRQWASFE